MPTQKTIDESIDEVLDDPKVRARLRRWAATLVAGGEAGALFLRLDVKNGQVRGASVGAEEPRARAAAPENS